MHNEISRTAQGYLMEAKVLQALSYTREYVSKHPGEVDGWYWQGISLIFAKKYLAALEAFEQCERLSSMDYEVMFAIAVTHYVLGNYQLGGHYMCKFMEATEGGGSDDDNIGRAAMLAMAGAFSAGILFLEYINAHNQQRSPKLDAFAAGLYDDHIDYAFKQRPRLGDKWLMLQNIGSDNKDAMKRLVIQLIGDLSWGDAVYLYRKHLCEKFAAGCKQSATENACLYCISRKLLPPPFMFCPGLFTGREKK